MSDSPLFDSCGPLLDHRVPLSDSRGPQLDSRAPTFDSWSPLSRLWWPSACDPLLELSQSLGPTSINLCPTLIGLCSTVVDPGPTLGTLASYGEPRGLVEDSVKPLGALRYSPKVPGSSLMDSRLTLTAPYGTAGFEQLTGDPKHLAEG